MNQTIESKLHLPVFNQAIQILSAKYLKLLSRALSRTERQRPVRIDKRLRDLGIERMQSACDLMHMKVTQIDLAHKQQRESGRRVREIFFARDRLAEQPYPS